MKVANNKSDSKKRKRDESQGAIGESPKKAKVHAQRKFAQGASYNSPSLPLIKDKVRPPANVNNSDVVLSTKRPHTEDFLTFLCFRRSQILPNKLDYFNNPFKEQCDSPNNIEETQTSTGSHKNSHFENAGRSNSRKSDKNQAQKKVQTPVQALRRKYHEQRLAKRNPTNLTKLARKVKGKNMVRTRSSASQEEKTKPAKEEVQLPLSGLRSGLQRAPPSTSKYLKKSVKVAQMKNLRSRVKAKVLGNKLMTKPSFGKKSLKYSPRRIATKRYKGTRSAKLSEISSNKANAKKTDGLSDFSSDDNEPLLTVKKAKSIAKRKKLANGTKENLRANSVKTRSQNSSISEPIQNLSLRPTRKTKEAAAIYMEMITKKLVSPDKSGDDDRSSLDSFPELPNAKRNEQRETEIKAKAMAMKKENGKGNNTNQTTGNKKNGNLLHKKKDIGKKNSITTKKTELTKKKPKDNELKKLIKQEVTKRVVKEQTKKVVKGPVTKKQAKEEISKKVAKNVLPKKYVKEEGKSKVTKEENSKKPGKDDNKKKPKEELSKKETSKKVAREDTSKKAHEEPKKNQKNKKEDSSNKNMKEENGKASDDNPKKNAKEESGKKALKEEMNKKATREASSEDSLKSLVKEDSSKKKEESGKKSSKEEVNKKATQEVLHEDSAKKTGKEDYSKKKEESGKKSSKEENKKAVQEVSLEDSTKKPNKADLSKKKEESGKKSSKEEKSKKVTQEVSSKDHSKKSLKEDNTRRKEEPGRKAQHEDAAKKVTKDESPKKNGREETDKKRGVEDLSREMSDEDSCESTKEPEWDEPLKKIMKGDYMKKSEGVTKKPVKGDGKKGEDTTKNEVDTNAGITKKGVCDDVTKKMSKDNVKKTLKEEAKKKNSNEDSSTKIGKDEASKKGGVKEKKESKSFDENASGELNEVPKSSWKKEKLVENGSDDETPKKVSKDDLKGKREAENEKQAKDTPKITGENELEAKEKFDKSGKEPCVKSDVESTQSEKEKESDEEFVKDASHESQNKASDSEEDQGKKVKNSTETKDGTTRKRKKKKIAKESESDSMSNKSDTEPRPSTRGGRKQEEPENKPRKGSDRGNGSKRPNGPPKKGSAAGSSAPNGNWLPPPGSASNLVEAPTFYPTEKEFQDPLEFFERIRPAAESFGLCRIVPPNTFKPDCKVSDDMRFTAYNQYVHRMFHRWGPNIKEMMAIKKYLATQSISLKQPPWIGGIEVDLPRLYQSVQNCGGLMKVMEKKKWNQVADMMRIPKAAQDRVTKLDDIYCKYLLPYDTLSQAERQKLFDEVESDWLKRQDSTNDAADDESEEEFYIDECEECIVKGRNMALNQFYRIARNTMSMWFKTQEPLPSEVENEFWRHVSERNNHVCVHSGSIDSSGWGYGFPVAKNNTFSKHPWNLKVLTNNSGSILRSLGPVMGVTVPTLHVGMVFTAFCWYRDPHGLPWVEYLHTGAPKIWYGISDDNSSVFKEALTKLLPRYIKNKKIWLPSDTAMVPPALLVEQGVSLCHTIQQPGQFILVFPRAFTSSICTGYLVSESVYFAQSSWLTTAEQVFRDIQDCCEPTMFSLEKLLFSIATDSRANVEVLKQVLPMVWHIKQNEIDGRKTLLNLGLKVSERLPARDQGGGKKKKGRWAQDGEGDYECEVCRTNLCVSLVINSQEETVLCLPHAIELLTQKRNQLKHCKLMYSYTQEELCELVEKLEQKIESKSQKKTQSKSSSSSK